MGHEIEKLDAVVLHRQQAWHGLGIVVEDAPTPLEALRIAKLDWTVEKWPLSATDGKNRLLLPDKFLNVRTDAYHPLGIVGKDWEAFQNIDLAKFCEALAEAGDTVKIESAGSIRNGQKVFFLLKGESFSVRGHDGDEIKPYILASNGFDCITSCRFTPTSVRVVCSNTLHAVIPDERKGRVRVREAGYSIVHSGKLKDRLEEVKAALKLYGKSINDQREMIDALAARDMTNEAANRFFLECYARQFGAIADVPTTTKEKREREKAIAALGMMQTRFTREADTVSGGNRWTAFNAYSGWLQHDRTIRRKDEAKANDLRVATTLFGDVAWKTEDAFAIALSS